ncbi:hypothetical protein HDU87_000104 [Geranomyces variabilis]|uniref:Uncharacterized protein n=1 Tax=Geranomyces variabilis TaxID=109894 RepID=A0AAD5TSC3_9FUNG|nr:hypothetical protein HDU87_000104 [Geranomyces variabilis]
MEQSDKTRVQVLVNIATEMGVLQQYLGRVLLRRTFERAKAVPEEIAHLETTVRLALGPPALNCAPGGVHHIITLSASTTKCISDLRSAILQPTAELLAENDGRDTSKDEILRTQIRDAYATAMPAEFRELMTNEVLQLAVEQSCDIETGASAILGKDIPVEAFKNAIPFYSVESPGRGPRLIAEAERHILGEIISTSRGRLAFRGPFRNLWEVLVHVLWKLARIWLGNWLKVVRPVAVFAMGGQLVRALLNGVISNSPRTSSMRAFRLAGRPMVVSFGEGSDDVCLVVPCIDPGKAAYNALASPFEQESIVIAKAIHSLAVALVLRLWHGEGTLAEFLSEIPLKRQALRRAETGSWSNLRASTPPEKARKTLASDRVCSRRRELGGRSQQWVHLKPQLERPGSRPLWRMSPRKKPPAARRCFRTHCPALLSERLVIRHGSPA